VNTSEDQESGVGFDESSQQGAAAKPSGVGEILAQARLATGLSVEDIARQLRFGVRQIQALEAGRLEQLPGPTFVRGIVRSYARLLKLDPAPLIEQLEGKFDVPDANRLATLFKQPVPFSDGARQSNMVYGLVTLGVLVIAGVLAYQWWYRDKTPAQPKVEATAASPTPVEQPAAATVATAPQAAPPATQAPLAPAPQAAKPASASTAPAVPSAPSAPGAARAAAAAQVQAPPVPPSVPVARGKRRVEFEFEEESWVEVTNGLGQVISAHLNPPGSRKVVDGVPPLTIVIGNAQHVTVFYKDKPIDLKPYIKVEVARLVLE
jgi:cytoskeleton protein RodZ